MTRDQAKQEIKSRYADYLQPAKKHGTYICPLCKNGTGSTGDGITVKPGTTHLKCFKCSFGGDLIDLYQREHGATMPEAFAALCERFNIAVDDHTAAPVKTQPAPTSAPATGGAEAQADYKAYFIECGERLTDREAIEYLSFRGISLETAAQYGLGFDPAWRSPQAVKNGRNPPTSPRLIIPTSASSYLARDTRRELTEQERRFAKMKEGAAQLFNPAALTRAAENAPVFIVEGEIDALSIIEAGGEAVATGSTSNTHKLLEYIEEHGTKATLLLCPDNDEAGRRAGRELAEGLQGLNIAHLSVDITGGHKDANEALTSDRAAFIDAVQAAQRSTSATPDSVTAYINSLMAGEIENFRRSSTRKTGFENLDRQAGGIYPGLYVLGAISSLGKTTFIHQVADQMAAAGEHILFFSMEQSRLEMVSKSLARITAQRDISTACTSLSIRGGRLIQAALDAARAYTEAVQDHMSVIEGNFACTVSFIGEYVRRYMSRNKVKPVVIVDYLQILQGEGRQTTKEQTDGNMTELKRMSRALDLPIIVVSSVNRSNYLAPIDFESFKESGGIEYTADVVWGLQLSALNEDLFLTSKDKDVIKKRDRVREAKQEMPRQVELVCLKNRYGISSYKASFEYYPQFDLFRPAESEDAAGAKRF